ncbi:hypothetical protein N0V88_001964 [Collariella sp. IMI 366227]|nr:hypothetical protein N0V88_001964 [Collariella sp. IMI 366227]
MVAAELVGMSFDYNHLPVQGPGCLMPNRKGGYSYVPYTNPKDEKPFHLDERVKMINQWLQNAENCHTLAEVDKTMENEINDKCFFEFLDGGDASRLDFYGKVNMLAKYRLMKDGIDISPIDPFDRQFRFAVTDVNKFGEVAMKWIYLDRNSDEATMLRYLEANSRSNYEVDAIVPQQIRELETIQQPEDAVQEARKLIEELKAMKNPNGSEEKWTYALCDPDVTEDHLINRTWIPLKLRNDAKYMRRQSRELSKVPVLVRIYKLLQRQIQHAKDTEKEALAVTDEETGKPYFDGGWVSTMDCEMPKTQEEKKEDDWVIVDKEMGELALAQA